MAKSILDIIIRTVKQGGADKETVAGLANIKKGLMEAGVIAGTFVAAYYAVDKALDATVGTFVAYAAQVRETSRLTGTSAEDTSRLIQMADDLAISYESLQKALWFAAKNGMDVNVDSMAALADEYVALGSASDKAEFLAKKFGKSGAEMGKLLEQGGAGVRAANDAISGNLVLTEEAVQKAREYEIAVDNLTDSWEGFKVAIGGNIIGPLVTLLNKVNAEIKEEGGSLIQAEKGWRMLLGPIGAVWNAIDLFSNKTEAATFATEGLTSTMNSASEGAANYSNSVREIDYGSLLDSTFTIQDGLQGFADKAADIQAKIAELDPTSEAYAETLSGLEGELRANAAAQEQWAKKLVFSMVQARLAVGGIDSGEFAFLIELGVQMGLVDEKTAATAQNINSSLDSIDFTQMDTWKSKWQTILDMPDSKDIYLNYIQTGDMDGGSCFVAGTPITTRTGTAPIESVRAGDVILMKTQAGTVIEVFVSRTMQSARDDLVSVETRDGRRFHCSPNHRWQRADGAWVEARDLQGGDALNSITDAVQVARVLPYAGRHAIYNLTVAHAEHTYLVDGLVVHNAKTPGSLAQPNGGGHALAGAQTIMSSSSSSSVTNSGTTIHIYNPTFTVTSGKAVRDVLEALT